MGYWLALLALTCLIAVALELFDLPAAVLIGAMAAGVVLGVSTDGAIGVPVQGFAAAQAVLGCVIASSLTPGFLDAFLSNWLLFVGAVLATVMGSSVLGWMISHWKVLPGTVGVWGAAPGASTAMVLMAGAFGADQRLVAVMQYLRVIMVSIGAVFIARLWVDTSGVEAAATVWFPPIEPVPFAAMIAVAVAGMGIAALVRLPSPQFLGPFILGAFLHLQFGVEYQLPPWLLAASFALIGWRIGLQFRADTLRTAGRALPKVILSILALMAFCGGIGWLLAHVMGVDPLTAYLATSPGGMDTVAIISAASGNVDVTFVMTMQALRFLVVLIVGPPIARLVAGWVKP